MISIIIWPLIVRDETGKQVFKPHQEIIETNLCWLANTGWSHKIFWNIYLIFIMNLREEHNYSHFTNADSEAQQD